MKNKIQLFPTPQAWMARFIGPHAEGVIDAFGCDVIPTPFTAKANAETVRRAIANRNPGVDVDVLVTMLNECE